jgi:putative tryptophan/tyrosine transport system substrate-binding protein
MFQLKANLGVIRTRGRAMQRRVFVKVIGGAAASWSLPARAQERIRRIGILFGGFAADDSEGQARMTALIQGLQERGWTDGRNVRIEYRWAVGDPERQRKYAAELVALAPDVMVSGGLEAAAALQQASRNIPIVFGNISDPVGAGLVASLARPGGNSTGFMTSEFSFSAKWLELLKQIAPHATRVAFLRTNAGAQGIGEFTAIQAAAPSFGVEVTPITGRVPAETERAITAFARKPDGGMIVMGGGIQQPQREAIIAAAARHRLPAIYPFRRFVVEGGLVSFGIDNAELYRLAAGYVDRILKGEKPGDLPVQAPVKLETVLNLKTAKALGAEVPATVRVRADEVIE